MTRPHVLQRTFLHLDRLVNTNSCDLLSLEGRVEPEILREALQLAAARHPLARSLLGPAGWGDGAPPVALELATVEGDSLDAVVDAAAAHTWSRRLDLAKEAPIRAVLLRGPARDHVCLIGPHATTDARSGARIAEDVAVAYTGLVEGGASPAPLIPRVDAPKVTLGELARAVVALLRDVVSAGAGVSVVEPPGAGWGAAGFERATPRVRVIDLGAPLLAGLRAAARAQGVTVHTLALLALHRARTVRERSGPLAETPFRLLDLVSLRPRIPGSDDAWDVLVTPFTRTLPAVRGVGADGSDAGESEATLKAAIARQASALKAGGDRVEVARLVLYDALAGWVPTEAAARLVFRFVTRTNVVLTNPGPVPWPVDRLGPTRVAEFVSFPSPMPPARLALSLTTWRDRLRLVVLHDPVAFPGGVEDLVGPFVAGLRERAGA